MQQIQAVWSRTLELGRRGSSWLVHQARLTLDLDRFRAATDWRQRAAAVSWPRAAIAGGGTSALIALAAVGVWMLHGGSGSHAPRLPTEQAWRASQAAGRAMETDLSPALAQANQSVTPRAEP